MSVRDIAVNASRHTEAAAKAQSTHCEPLVQKTEPEKLERAKGIEPSSSAWEADALPLCFHIDYIVLYLGNQNGPDLGQANPTAATLSDSQRKEAGVTGLSLCSIRFAPVTGPL